MKSLKIVFWSEILHARSEVVNVCAPARSASIVGLIRRRLPLALLPLPTSTKPARHLRLSSVTSSYASYAVTRSYTNGSAGFDVAGGAPRDLSNVGQRQHRYRRCRCVSGKNSAGNRVCRHHTASQGTWSSCRRRLEGVALRAGRNLLTLSCRTCKACWIKPVGALTLPIVHPPPPLFPSSPELLVYSLQLRLSSHKPHFHHRHAPSHFPRNSSPTR